MNNQKTMESFIGTAYDGLDRILDDDQIHCPSQIAEKIEAVQDALAKALIIYTELVAITTEVAKGRANLIDEDFARARDILAKIEGGAK